MSKEDSSECRAGNPSKEDPSDSARCCRKVNCVKVQPAIHYPGVDGDLLNVLYPNDFDRTIEDARSDNNLIPGNNVKRVLPREVEQKKRDC